MSSLINFVSEIDLNDFTVIIPSVSVGNVPQLTVDLIISSFNLLRTGIIWHPAIVPSVGGDPFEKNSSEVTTACELYANKDLRLAVIQMRSSIEQLYAQSFFELLLKSVNDLKVKSLVILTSAFAHEMHDVKSSLFRYLSSNNDVVSDIQALSECNVIQGIEEELQAGTGFGLKLYKMAIDIKIQTFLLCKYSSEGDNRPDALQMLGVLHKLFNNFQTQHKEFALTNVRFPMSWDHVFGNPPPLGIY